MNFKHIYKATELYEVVYYWMQPLTAGPQRGPLVTQQTEVLHMEHRTQSQPSFFMTTIWHVGQYIASPFDSIFCNCKRLFSQITHKQ